MTKPSKRPMKPDKQVNKPKAPRGPPSRHLLPPGVRQMLLPSKPLSSDSSVAIEATGKADTAVKTHKIGNVVVTPEVRVRSVNEKAPAKKKKKKKTKSKTSSAVDELWVECSNSKCHYRVQWNPHWTDKWGPFCCNMCKEEGAGEFASQLCLSTPRLFNGKPYSHIHHGKKCEHVPWELQKEMDIDKNS